MSSPHLPDSGTPADYSGDSLGDFELVRRIGIGGMGQVYLARQKSLKRQVAVKVLKQELAANETMLKRFQAEAEAVASLTHANIVQVYAIGEDRGLHFIALEYVDGRNLKDYLEKRGVLEIPVALHVLRRVAAALERAGELGFVHRDIKPENILLSRKGEIKLTDFGLSRCFSAEQNVHLTQSGITMGTPLYMAPEQVRGQAIDPRADIYALGVTAFHLLTGEPPFHGTTAFDVALQHVQEAAPSIRAIRPDVPEELEAIIMKMMAKSPTARYQSARELIADLEQVRRTDVGGSSTGFQTTRFVQAMVEGSAVIPATPSQVTVSVKKSWSFLRYGVLLILFLISATVGYGIHWYSQTNVMPLPAPKEALADLDAPPGSGREKELKRLLMDKQIRSETAVDALMELALWYIHDGRTNEAMQLFDPQVLAGYGFTQNLPAARKQSTAKMISGLGKAVVLAHQDKSAESNAEFSRLVADFMVPKAKVTPNPKTGARGSVLEQFLLRQTDSPTWKRAVYDALSRNEINLNSQLPVELRRLKSFGPRPTGA
ncbi:MAG: serine/threonine-protein kinase [Zavarzinella sp.]